ncbi:MAG: hypothetical protein DRP45_10370, partial [Candidatus Zixiibacteriota bacterium]
MNIATARSAGRAREVGLRKAAGAQRWDLMKQFYAESYLLSFLALLVAVALTELILPIFNALCDKQLSFELVGRLDVCLGLLGVMIVTGFVAGSYPALYMSAFRPARIFAGILGSGARKSGFRRGLVIWQFVV